MGGKPMDARTRSRPVTVAGRMSAAFLPLLLATAAFAQDPPTTPPAPEATPAEVLLVTDLVPGIGNEVLPGMIAVVHYAGWLYDPAAADLRGKPFDSSRARGQPFSFPVGAGRVIRGWDQGVPGMKVGGVRQLVIPPSLAYGARDIGNGLIPPNSTLVFEVELLAVETVTLTPEAK
ncbi:MAG: FKBP-type peptidyl-prolyl cis-trans isomerase [Steroidobacteraceae bacterium]|nr:FKBP-type peptidyl-prolyl cis-trans isomerase [Steroidobacteraceae bacterium]